MSRCGLAKGTGRQREKGTDGAEKGKEGTQRQRERLRDGEMGRQGREMHTEMRRKGSPGRMSSSRNQMHGQREVGPFIGGRKAPRDYTQKDRMTRQWPSRTARGVGKQPPDCSGRLWLQCCVALCPAFPSPDLWSHQQHGSIPGCSCFSLDSGSL